MKNKIISVLAASSVALTALMPMAASASVDLNLVGGNVVMTTNQSYNEPGYSAFSSFDGDITNQVVVNGLPSVLTPGTYTVGYSVTDSNLDSASAFRSVQVNGFGSGMIYCSGPMAPGWNVSLPNGGCPVVAPVYFPTATKQEANGSYTFGIVR